MRRLWAPWREPYVTRMIGKTRGCVFCRIRDEREDRKNLIFARTPQAFAVLNLYPYNNGHCLVLPLRHVKDPARLRSEELLGLMTLVNRTKALLDATLKPAGYNIGINLGHAAGAGFPGHLHVHVVPRWKGDVNFMPVVGGTRVMSQSLRTLHRILADAHRRREE